MPMPPQHSSMFMDRQAGFTLLETLVALLIAGIAFSVICVGVITHLQTEATIQTAWQGRMALAAMNAARRITGSATNSILGGLPAHWKAQADEDVFFTGTNHVPKDAWTLISEERPAFAIRIALPREEKSPDKTPRNPTADQPASQAR